MPYLKKSYSSGAPKRGFSKPRFGSTPRRDSSAPLEFFTATCSNCNKSCEVPFKPNGKKPVFCKNCFGTQKDDAASQSRSYARPRESTKQGSDLGSQIELINAKLDKLTRLVQSLTE